MKRTITLTLALTLSASLLFSQSKAWEKQFSGSVNWQRVTSLGFLLVNTSNGLYGIDTENGNVLWENLDLAGIPESSYSPIPKSPFVKISLEGEQKTVIVLDPIEGKILFNSKEEGISEINEEYVLLKNTAILIVGLKEGRTLRSLICVDMSNGKVSWTKDDEFSVLTAVKEVDGEDFIATTLFYMYRINSSTGEVVWKGSLDKSNPMANMSAQMAGALQTMAGSMLKPGDVIVELYLNSKADAIYAGVQVRKEKPSQTEGGAPTITFPNSYIKFDALNGEMPWKAPIKFAGKMGSVNFHPKGMMVFPRSDANTKINIIDTRTGAGLWGKKGNGVKVKGSVIDHRVTDKGILIVTGKKEKALINIVNVSTGELLFNKYEKVKGLMEYVEITTSGLLYISEQEANILDMTTGLNKWDKSLTKDKGAFVLDGDMIYVYSSKGSQARAIDKNTGTFSGLSTAEIELNGKELAKSMEMYKGDVLINSEQNLVSISTNGSTEFHAYHEAPREPGLTRALLYAQAVRAAYIGGVSKLAAGAYASAADQQENEVNQVMVQGISEAYDQIGDAGLDYAKKAMAAANARFKASSQTQDFVFMMTKLASKDHALVQISKEDGSVSGQVNMGRDKAPSYEVDAITNKVYYRESSNKVVAYQF